MRQQNNSETGIFRYFFTGCFWTFMNLKCWYFLPSSTKKGSDSGVKTGGNGEDNRHQRSDGSWGWILMVKE